jgi:hypothetical protein
MRGYRNTLLVLAAISIFVVLAIGAAGAQDGNDQNVTRTGGTNNRAARN